MNDSTTQPPVTRIQREKRQQILEAALEVFSAHGFRGATIDQIADAAMMSKPNLLYYFASKEEMHKVLIERLLDTWLAPLREMRADGDPAKEISSYVQRKLGMARDFPRESRLFANELLRGAPHIIDMLTGELKELMDEKTAIISDWMAKGKLIKVDPHHLLFAIWGTTQHYADFDVQVRATLGPERDGDARFDEASAMVEQIFVRGLMP